MVREACEGELADARRASAAKQHARGQVGNCTGAVNTAPSGARASAHGDVATPQERFVASAVYKKCRRSPATWRRQIPIT
jgi:hypothetical protein